MYTIAAPMPSLQESLIVNVTLFPTTGELLLTETLADPLTALTGKTAEEKTSRHVTRITTVLFIYPASLLLYRGNV